MAKQVVNAGQADEMVSLTQYPLQVNALPYVAKPLNTSFRILDLNIQWFNKAEEEKVKLHVTNRLMA